MRIQRNWVVLGTALAVGLIAALAVKHYISQRIEALKPVASTSAVVEVVVAGEDLAKGTRLSASNVAVRKVPREWTHSNVIQPQQFERAEHAALATPAARGEPILWAQLEGQQAASFSSRLMEGRRAITVAVDEISSISGMVSPGDAIDLIVAFRRGAQVVMLPLMQDVKVLATGTQVQPGGRNDGSDARTFTTVTLDATPDDARRIMAAREVGRITALLRAPGDSGRHGMRAADAMALLGVSPEATVVSGRRPVQVLYGGRTGAAQAVLPLPAVKSVAGVADADPPRTER